MLGVERGSPVDPAMIKWAAVVAVSKTLILPTDGDASTLGDPVAMGVKTYHSVRPVCISTRGLHVGYGQPLLGLGCGLYRCPDGCDLY